LFASARFRDGRTAAHTPGLDEAGRPRYARPEEGNMRRSLFLTSLWGLTGGGLLLAQTTPVGSLSGSTGGGRPSNGGGAVLPSTKFAGRYATALGPQPGPMWLGLVKGRALPGSGVDRTMADFGGIAPNDLGPATRPDAGLGNPSTSTVRPDAGIGNPSTSTVRPDAQISISRFPPQPPEYRFAPWPVARVRSYVGLPRHITVFAGEVKMAGVINPGWATRNGNAAAPSTAAPAVAKGTIYAPSAGGYTAEPLPRTGPAVPGVGGVTRPVPRTGIVSPETIPVPNPTTTPGPGGPGR
jgi:hypothetical protein